MPYARSTCSALHSVSHQKALRRMQKCPQPHTGHHSLVSRSRPPSLQSAQPVAGQRRKGNILFVRPKTNILLQARPSTCHLLHQAPRRKFARFCILPFSRKAHPDPLAWMPRKSYFSVHRRRRTTRSPYGKRPQGFDEIKSVLPPPWMPRKSDFSVHRRRRKRKRRTRSPYAKSPQGFAEIKSVLPPPCTHVKHRMTSELQCPENCADVRRRPSFRTALSNFHISTFHIFEPPCQGFSYEKEGQQRSDKLYVRSDPFL